MEVIIVIAVGAVIALLSGNKKRSKKKSIDKVNAKNQKISQDDEDLITIILPTINNDK